MNARQAICYGRVAKARAPSGGTRILSTHPDFRRAYLANAVSQLGNALQFVALMWFAVESAGPLGVVAVRLVDALPALLFGLHGGVVADRWDRRRTMIGTDLLRGLVLLPLAVAGIAGTVPLWALVATAFVLTTGASYFTPAFAALLPSIVGKTELQRANGLVNATNAALQVGGWAVAAVVLGLVSPGAFFAINAVSFFASAVLLARIPAAAARERSAPTSSSTLRDGFAGLRTRAGLPAAVTMLGTLHLPGYLLLGLGSSLAPMLAGTFLVGAGCGAAILLVTSATQESLPGERLGRAMGVVFLGHAGTKPLGLVAIAPLYAVVDARLVFVAGALATFACALVAVSVVRAATLRAARGASATT